nr:hypothetical protein [uncultured bacterium]
MRFLFAGKYPAVLYLLQGGDRILKQTLHTTVSPNYIEFDVKHKILLTMR